ncbi:MAG: hypothetical protein HMLIMOIP_002572 [Candidatus Nitrosomirales archaeon]|jgi:hypothetical protein
MKKEIQERDWIMMLSKEEELRLSCCIEVLKTEIEGKTHSVLTSPPLVLATQMWIASKLKEVNDELIKVYEELQEAHRLNGTLSDELYGMI